jgi:hypothetical protein
MRVLINIVKRHQYHIHIIFYLFDTVMRANRMLQLIVNNLGEKYQ